MKEITNLGDGTEFIFGQCKKGVACVCVCVCVM